MSNPSKPPKPVITVRRLVTPHGDRCWYFSDGKPVSMAPVLAVQAARQGQVRIRTIGDERRPK